MKLAVALLSACVLMRAESGYDTWLRYAPVTGLVANQATSYSSVVALGKSPILDNARKETIRGFRGMTGRTLREVSSIPRDGAIVLGTFDQLAQADTSLAISVEATGVGPEGFAMKVVSKGATRYLVIASPTERGVLYGAFHLLRRMSVGESLANLDDKQTPVSPVRWLNHWDNLDGTIERGYGGRSIFWENNKARADLSRANDYGRMLASIGVNATSVNNVNANPRVLAADFLPELARVADTLRPWGVQVVISVDFGSPQKTGGLDTFDPLDPKVIAWWKETVDRIYTGVPDLAGIIIKADSEGRVGPSAYKRTHADAANVVARALKPHGGRIFYRGFVYSNKLDKNDPKADRGRAAYDNFKTLDGQFDDNVVLQVKNGPIDFQVREAVSPLFAALDSTNQALELQVTQEYMGQARHTVFLVPQWKEYLDTDLRKGGASPGVAATPVKKLIAKVGMVGVTNVGLDDNWFGNHMSAANLYGFGRLAWNPDLTSRQIADEWTKQTFGSDPAVVKAVEDIQLTSWRTYENYTGTLGLLTLTDIAGNHYGVAVEASERDGWGEWHKADAKGVGMDRSVATGTGFIGQYPPALAAIYENLATCPDDLILFLHHVPYTHKLHSGKTVIQTLYDAHYDGALAAQQYATEWKGLAGKVDERRYSEVLAQLDYQAGAAQLWRDAVNQWFAKATGIADEKGRVGKYPGRIEAESMMLDGYKAADIRPWEAASGQVVTCSAAACSATFTFNGAAGWHNLRVRYFDQNNGESKFRVKVGDQVIDEWTANLRLPSARLDGTSSTRRVISGVALRPGDAIRVEGIPNGIEQAALDYVEID